MSAQRDFRGGEGPQAEGAPVPVFCPRCKGRNAATAAWCGQCLTRFEVASPPLEEPRVTSAPERAAAPSSPEAAPMASQATGPEAAPAAPVGSPGTPPNEAGIRATSGGFVWACARCGADNPLAAMVCSVCDAPFADLFREAEPARPARDAGKAALMSLFMPGAGHAYLGLWGEGIARAVLSTLAGSAFFAGAIGGGGAQRLLVAGLFALVSAALWGVTAHDAYREAQGQTGSVILRGRAFLWVVVGLLVALVVALVLPAIGAARA